LITIVEYYNDEVIYRELKNLCSYLVPYNDSAILTVEDIKVESAGGMLPVETTVETAIKTKVNSELIDTIKQHIININKSGNKELQGISNLFEEYLNKINNIRTIGITEYAVYGGSNRERDMYYIEYFLKHPNNMTQVDKDNIRNIIENENYDKKLSEFIRNKLKL
jgi:hypothetical protein